MLMTAPSGRRRWQGMQPTVYACEWPCQPRHGLVGPQRGIHTGKPQRDKQPLSAGHAAQPKGVKELRSSPLSTVAEAPFNLVPTCFFNVEILLSDRFTMLERERTAS